MARSCKFCFTLNNYTEDDILSLQNLVCEYIVFGREVAPTTGTPHLQGYVSFKSQATFDQLHKRAGLERASFRVAKGDAKSNQVYCTKEDPDFFEKGVPPKSQKEKGEGEQKAWADAIICVQENRLEDIRPDILVRNLKQVEYAVLRLAGSKRKLTDLEGPLEHEWIWGPTGTGKTTHAKLENPDAYIHMVDNKWFDGYDFEEVIIMDEVGLAQGKFGAFWKRYADRTPVRVEVKNGAMLIRPRKVVVTSNKSIREVFPDPDDYLPLERKFKIRHLVFPFVYTPPPGAVPAGPPVPGEGELGAI